MDEFARMMLREGVRSMHTPGGHKASQPRSSDNRQSTSTHTNAAPVETPPTAAPTMRDNSIAWVTGNEARDTVVNALAMLKRDQQAGKAAWINYIRQDGSSWREQAGASLGAIMTKADTENIRMIIFGGDQWTAILHPSIGAATIEQDPEGAPD